MEPDFPDLKSSNLEIQAHVSKTKLNGHMCYMNSLSALYADSNLKELRCCKNSKVFFFLSFLVVKKIGKLMQKEKKKIDKKEGKKSKGKSLHHPTTNCCCNNQC
ncbi:hypothetical protein L1049_010258 [Liquidambar formosana]|uniref:Uncharacterized protein n=1 Tax=Liquidambar formosana TaxID=63359 RepID=A0AAP0R1Q3_LIQFO